MASSSWAGYRPSQAWKSPTATWALRWETSRRSTPTRALASAAESLDVSALLDVGREPPEPGPVQPGPVTEARVAVAQDEAFCFTYAATLERLRERAEVVAFSPVAGDDLPGSRRDLPPRWVSGTPTPRRWKLASAHARSRNGPPTASRCTGECGGDDGPWPSR